ncbi:MAG TPA: hypothetical protein VHO29_03705 [Marmoricola sp.]|nr:hypothetical protein [Marmoricola sp.]
MASTGGRRAWASGVLGAVALTAACGSTSTPVGGPESARSIITPSAKSMATELSLEQLRSAVLDAVRARSTVHLAIGNQNPPPVVQVVEDYSRRDGDLEATFTVGHGSPPSVVCRRVGGEVYVSIEQKPFERVASENLAAGGGGALLALLRTDVLRDLTALLGAATTSTYDGPDGSVTSGAVRFRLTIDTDRWFTAAQDGVALGIPGRAGLPGSVPATLWIAPNGLPVRLEVRHSDPLNGVPGTGTSRIDYSHWGEPVEIERPPAQDG